MGPPKSVLTQPGWPELTFIFVSFSSLARWTVKAFSAVLEVLYANSFAGVIGESFAEWRVKELRIVETFTILPALDFFINGRSFWVKDTTEKKLVWNVSFKSFSGIVEHSKQINFQLREHQHY